MDRCGVRRAGVALAWLLALPAGCAHPSARAAPVVPPAEVRAVASQTRFDEVDPGHFEVTVTNLGRRPFTVTSVRLDAPAFAPSGAVSHEEAFAPSASYDLPALFGSARCGRPPTPATAVVELHRDRGPSGTIRVPLASPDGLLPRIQRQECAKQALARQVRVFLTGVRQEGRMVRAALRVQRHGSRAQVTATELRDSKLFAFTVRLPAQLDASADVLDIPAVIRPAACYAHLLGDVKQPYLFPLFLRLDRGAPQYVEVATTEAQHAQLQTMLRAACAGRRD